MSIALYKSKTFNECILNKYRKQIQKMKEIFLEKNYLGV